MAYYRLQALEVDIFDDVRRVGMPTWRQMDEITAILAVYPFRAGAGVCVSLGGDVSGL